MLFLLYEIPVYLELTIETPEPGHVAVDVVNKGHVVTCQ